MTTSLTLADHISALADRLLALEEMAPGSTTPAEAARMLGVILDDYLAGAA